MKLTLCALSVGVFGALNATTTQAQTTKPNQIDDVIEVHGHKLSVINKDAAGSITAMDSEAMARRQQAELTQILREIPGVELSGGVTPLAAQPSVRGLYGERIHVSVDNVKRKIESDGNENLSAINSLGIDPSQLKQVQVLRGADSLTVGSGAIGGSIRLVTKDASDYLHGKSGVGAKVMAMHQSNSDSTLISGSLFSLSDNMDTVLHVSRVTFSDIDVVGSNIQDTEAQAINEVAKLDKIKNDSERKNVALKNTWFISKAHSVQSKVDWSESRSDDQPYNLNAGYGLAYPALSQDFSNDYLEITSTYVYQPDNRYIDFDAQFVYSDKDYEKQTFGYIMRGERKIDFSGTKQGSTKRYGARFANLVDLSDEFDHQIAVELNYDYETFSQSEFSPDEGMSTKYGDSDAQNVSLSVIDHVALFDNKLLVTAGLRLDSYKRSSDVYTQFDDHDDSELSNELGLTFKVSDNINLYAKYSEAFRAPSVQDLYKKDEWRCHIGGKFCYYEPQPDLKPEESENLEGGFGVFWDEMNWGDKFELKVIHFDNEIVNFIDNVPFMYYYDQNGDKQQGAPGPEPANGVPVATHRDYSAKNIGKLVSRGWEVEMHYELGKFASYVGYSTINMDAYGVPNFFLGSVETNKQAYSEAPADKLNVSLQYHVFDNFDFGLQMLAYRSQRRLTDVYLSRGYGTDSYQLVNFTAKYQGTGSLSGLLVRVGIDNLTDERYVRAPAGEARDPSELGRNYKLTLSYTF
ncbi:TonB-dependent receptor [Pseudoalteromonas sp. SMS1]|uniref:TonB-dependent receptor domain-containing protein n=1 Tax=Pseudoalteromonas sp. SMS1 TaxID=2908894 RepID=UPI001F162F9A|nr:TonB-dependent receptor [Pseudoalteromonas sp. SMS1]MCF2859739.1 TonB-dependent receptor [Pseudoalteromonas sp. SMS1]